MSDYDKFVLALCLWREARNSQEGMEAVAWVIRNRLEAKKWGTTVADVVTEKLQFSSMTALGDPGTVVWPNSHLSPADAAAWQSAQAVVAQVMSAGTSQDPTNGSCYYFAQSIRKPIWALSLTWKATIGKQEFYA